jgi:DDE superfamily endonuclease
LAQDCKGLVTHNCLAGCDFNHKFTYISSGWQGSVSDSTMFFDSHITDLMIPLGKYYLANVGFPITSALLIPYQGVWYHLAEWGCADLWCVPFIDLPYLY